MLKFVSNHAHLLKQFLIIYSKNVITLKKCMNVSVVADGMVIMVITDTCQLHLNYLHYGINIIGIQMNIKNNLNSKLKMVSGILLNLIFHLHLIQDMPQVVSMLRIIL
jgi:hypothetical protein